MKKYKSLTYKVNDVDAEKGIVEFYSSSFGTREDEKDSDGDVIVKGAYSKTLKENFKRVRHLLNHQKSVGVPLDMKEDDFGLLVRSQLILGKQAGRELFEEYKVYAEVGNSMEHSVGFMPIKEEQGTKANFIKEVKLMDVTTMETWGANALTPQGALKGNNLEKAIETLEALLKGRFQDERLEQIETNLNYLKALINHEPSTGTHVEPHWKYLMDNLKI